MAIDSVANIIDSVSNKVKASKAVNLKPVVCAVICEWDPIGFKDPENEYIEEIKTITEKAAVTKDCAELGQHIYDVFKEMFGLRMFKKTIEECTEIAQRILE